jgi:hypothetical protein
VDRVESRLVNTSIFLTQGGNQQMVDSILSSLPTFYMCSIKIPLNILKHIDRYQRHGLWRRRGGGVTRPKMKGCLGIIKLSVQNDALLMKNLDKFFNKHDLPWVNLIWSNYYRNRRVTGEDKRALFGGGAC